VELNKCYFVFVAVDVDDDV